MPATNDFRPVILIRGFDPLGDVANSTYYGFNDGTVYPQKTGDDYIYEGMMLKFLKTAFRYRMPDGSIDAAFFQDATNVLRYSPYHQENTAPCVLKDDKVAERYQGNPRTVWVFRYYDFKTRDLPFYAEQLKLVIEVVEQVTGVQGVNLICHSMGGLVARYLIQKLYSTPEERYTHINKWVTLGTPHRGIAFQVLPGLDLWELEYFNRDDLIQTFGAPLEKIEPIFEPSRILCVVGTNYRAYNISLATKLNQFVSWLQGQDQNHSDGLVKQTSATLLGANRADVFKCHGGPDSLVTSREAFELATRFFFGDVRVSVYVEEAEIRNGYGGNSLLTTIGNLLDGKPEFYLGFSVKPRMLDFDLHRQDKESENCFGPFDHYLLKKEDFCWDNENPDAEHLGLIFRGFLNSALIPKDREDMAFRLDTYVGERDSILLGHTDTEIVNEQSYFQYEPVSQPPQLNFYPNRNAQPIVCEKPEEGVYRLTLKMGDLSPDFRMTLRIVIEQVL